VRSRTHAEKFRTAHSPGPSPKRAPADPISPRLRSSFRDVHPGQWRMGDVLQPELPGADALWLRRDQPCAWDFFSRHPQGSALRLCGVAAAFIFSPILTLSSVSTPRSPIWPARSVSRSGSSTASILAGAGSWIAMTALGIRRLAFSGKKRQGTGMKSLGE
jgi:hypothetical protein